MGKTSIGMVLNQLISEANLSAIHVAEKIGKTRQKVYLDLKRTSMRDEQIAEYAGALGIDKQVIYDRLQGRSDTSTSDYLQEHLINLETQFNELKEMFAEELSAKNRQIEKLMDLLGKLEGVSIEPVCVTESHSKKGDNTPFFMPFKRKFGYTPSNSMVAGSF